MKTRLLYIYHCTGQDTCYRCKRLSNVYMRVLDTSYLDHCWNCIPVDGYEHDYYIDLQWAVNRFVTKVELTDRKIAENYLDWDRCPDNIKATIRDHIYLKKL